MRDKRRVVPFEEFLVAEVVREIPELRDPTEFGRAVARRIGDRREFHEFRLESTNELRTFWAWRILRQRHNWIYTESGEYRDYDYTARLEKVAECQPNGTHFYVKEGGPNVSLLLSRVLVEVEKQVSLGRAELVNRAPKLGPLLLVENISFPEVSELVRQHRREAQKLVQKLVPAKVLQAISSPRVEI